MATPKVTISGFLNYFAPHGVMTNAKAPSIPPANQYGYVLGADGREATLAYITVRAKSSFPLSWKSYVERCRKWIGRKVWDCNSMAEGYYKEQTGISIDTKARLNYATWCDPKSSISADYKLTHMPQKPGVAVFRGTSASTISHVGYLLYKYSYAPLDWYVIEARGADYGVVITKLSERGWAWWGVMDKYFVYDLDDTWKPGDNPDIQVQSFYAICNGNDVNVRAGRSINTNSLGKLNKDENMLALTSIDGWCEVAAEIDGVLIVGYMSEQYVSKV